MYGFDLFEDRSPFDIIVDNGQLIPEATVSAAREGIARFDLVLRQCIDFHAGRRDRLAAEHAPFIVRCGASV
jgi:hypothetical protein